MSRLAVRLVDSHLYAVPTFLQGLLRHALPWLLGFAVIAGIFHYLYRDTEQPKLSLEARWLAVSSLWGIILSIAGIVRGLSELGHLTPDPLDTPIDALSEHPALLGLKIGCYGLGIGLVVWLSAQLKAAPMEARSQSKPPLNDGTGTWRRDGYLRGLGYRATRLVVDTPASNIGYGPRF